MDDATLLRSFEDLTLPLDQWTHRTHIKVAYLYLRDHPFDDALRRIRSGIQAFNAANDIPEGPLMGYNETTTVAFAHLIHAVARSYATSHPVGNADEFCDMHPQLLSKHILRLFYSPERRLHPDAKSTFIEPDLTALPTPSR